MQKLKNFFKDKGNIVLSIGIIFLAFSFTNLIYASYQKIKSSNIETVAFNDSIEITSEDLQKSARDIDANIGSGGGSNNDYSGAIGNSSITGTVRDEGVRVTLVDANTGEVITRPIDFANNPMPATRSFGWLDAGKHVKICKLQYKNGSVLQGVDLSSVGYEYRKPTVQLPTIVNGNLATIKSYFTDEWFLNEFSSVTGVPMENLKSGNYKIIIEPIGYPKINGIYYACTATELALFDQLLNGAIRSTLADFSHKNLPLSMFLEKEDFGIYPFDTSYANQRQSNETIILKLGIGILSAKAEDEPEEDVEIIVPQYTYRTNTTVYTSLNTVYASNVLTGSSSKGYSINATRVTFSLSDSSNGATILETKDIAYKSDDTVWVKWQTPSKPTTMKVIATIKYYTTSDNGNYIWRTETVEIPVEIEGLTENTPPNPLPDDRNNSFRYVNPSSVSSLNKTEQLKNSWKEYDLDIGEIAREKADGSWRFTYIPLWTTIEYTVELEIDGDIYPDSLVETDYYDSSIGSEVMKSGYGVRQATTGKVTTTIKTTREYLDADGNKKSETSTKTLKPSSNTNQSLNIAIPPQNGVSLFSDFGYKTYWRLLETTESYNGRSSTLTFKNNRFSTYNNPTHFTPIWYPDNTFYTVFTNVFDCWTPAGQLYGYAWDSVYILGNMWDDWYVQRLPADYDYYTNNPFN